MKTNKSVRVLNDGLYCHLGLDSEDGGGEIIVEGTPEEIVKVKNSSAGKHLKDALKPYAQ